MPYGFGEIWENSVSKGVWDAGLGAFRDWWGDELVNDLPPDAGTSFADRLYESGVKPSSNVVDHTANPVPSLEEDYNESKKSFVDALLKEQERLINEEGMGEFEANKQARRNIATNKDLMKKYARYSLVSRLALPQQQEELPHDSKQNYEEYLKNLEKDWTLDKSNPFHDMLQAQKNILNKNEYRGYNFTEPIFKREGPVLNNIPTPTPAPRNEQTNTNNIPIPTQSPRKFADGGLVQSPSGVSFGDRMAQHYQPSENIIDVVGQNEPPSILDILRSTFLGNDMERQYIEKHYAEKEQKKTGSKNAPKQRFNNKDNYNNFLEEAGGFDMRFAGGGLASLPDKHLNSPMNDPMQARSEAQYRDLVRSTDTSPERNSVYEELQSGLFNPVWDGNYGI